MIVVSVAFDAKGRLVGGPAVTALGVPEEDNEGEPLLPLIEETLEALMASLPRPKMADDRELETHIRRAIRAILAPRWGKRGDILASIIRA